MFSELLGSISHFQRLLARHQRVSNAFPRYFQRYIVAFAVLSGFLLEDTSSQGHPRVKEGEKGYIVLGYPPPTNS